MNIHVNRRQILGVIGTALAAPSLLIKEVNAKQIKRIDTGDIIPTGFDVVDEITQGGLHRGTISTVHEAVGSARDVFIRNIALNASDKVSVGIIKSPDNLYSTLENYDKFNGNLFYYPAETEIEELFEKHDLIFADYITEFDMEKEKEYIYTLNKKVSENNVSLVFKTNPLFKWEEHPTVYVGASAWDGPEHCLYRLSSIAFNMPGQFLNPYWSHRQSLEFAICKNRYGKSDVVLLDLNLETMKLSNFV